MKIRALIIILLLVGVLTACSESKKVYNYNSDNESHNSPIGYTSKGTPIVKDSYADIDWISTPNSTCFSKIGYDGDTSELYVVFNDSGAEYKYSEFSSIEWNTFKNADSLGKYYNAKIKGQYYCEKIDK